MHISLSTTQAADLLRNAFSYHARMAIINFYESLEDGGENPIEIDEAKIKGEWAEYSSIFDWAEQNRHMERVHDILADEEPEDHEEQLLKEMAWNFTQYIKLPDGGLVIGQF